eukprot:TRINITY_DN1091_c0_g1_i2.p1 TRINITY_DN1091_c0_g1~~TRINITY_DN1091_c0_g1_i2.p1  ORF type:complete len:604 (+),score=215.06 TRINITY_DN1091_c0_g1_i2:1332-3143(+)
MAPVRITHTQAVYARTRRMSLDTTAWAPAYLPRVQQHNFAAAEQLPINPVAEVDSIVVETPVVDTAPVVSSVSLDTQEVNPTIEEAKIEVAVEFASDLSQPSEVLSPMESISEEIIISQEPEERSEEIQTPVKQEMEEELDILSTEYVDLVCAVFFGKKEHDSVAPVVPEPVETAPTFSEQEIPQFEAPAEEELFQISSVEKSISEDDDEIMQWDTESDSSVEIAPSSPARGEQLYEDCSSPIPHFQAPFYGVVVPPQPDFIAVAWAPASPAVEQPQLFFTAQPQPSEQLQEYPDAWDANMQLGADCDSMAVTADEEEQPQMASFDPWDASTVPEDPESMATAPDQDQPQVAPLDPWNTSALPDDENPRAARFSRLVSESPIASAPGQQRQKIKIAKKSKAPVVVAPIARVAEEEDEEMDEDDDEPRTEWQKLMRAKSTTAAKKRKEEAKKLRVLFNMDAPVAEPKEAVVAKPVAPAAQASIPSPMGRIDVSNPKKLVVKFSLNQTIKSVSAPQAPPQQATEPDFDIFGGGSGPSAPSTNDDDMDPFIAGVAAEMMQTVAGMSEDAMNDEELGSDDDIDEDDLVIEMDDAVAKWNNYVACGGR